MLWELFWTFFKLGTFTFGSGYAMIPMIEREVVDRKKWFDREDFYNQFTLAQSAPGPFALNTAVFVGYKMKGWWGSLVAVLGVSISPFVIILLIAIYLSGFSTNPIVEAAFKGIRPAVIAMIAVPFITMMKGFKWYFIALALSVAVVVWLTGISPIWFLLAGAAVGVSAAISGKKRGEVKQ
ncbi:MAG: chromate transporter [Bacteroidales bacterium]|jgi:chromate transporter|nr:chromate transporter [Bacteroidales bacterium]